MSDESRANSGGPPPLPPEGSRGGPAPPPLPPASAAPWMPPPPGSGTGPVSYYGPNSGEAGVGERMLLPIGNSPWAVAAGYAGLFALILFPAPIALILGVIALRDIARARRAGRSGVHGKSRAIFAIIMGTVFSIPLVVLVVGLIVEALWPGTL